MIKEFKEFAMRGNVIDMAIGVVMGGAFGKIVDEIVQILMRFVAAVTGAVKFEDLAIKVGGVDVTYGAVLQQIISFIIIAFCMFIVVKSMNKVLALGKKEEKAEPTTKECPYCFTEIPIQATRCPNCTAEFEGYNNPVENK
ncbi:large conductance mechanosensitive channel protein MscL [Miniphocaeibacter halophilus]|uniref:Large conductance mechanosensitive channel protein MscL n=1 Tax=Miniphocaeibacter halophilus TaxID=2931922 RepID=A0AC61MRV3_9FIRM|nr:large conductance mechanosensitive channel protein MscL [Miniphocaeibacter halophilus]QQK08305.1 large conductance mechanosensitive channel protein MscL [Miniphocaeibacter halophilus]